MKQLLIALFLPVFTFAATNSFATTTCDSNSLDGVVAGSYPCFETSVKLKLKLAHDKVYTDELSASYYEDYRGPYLVGGGISLFHVTDMESYEISNTIFNFSASLQNDQVLSGGSMSIWGSINGSEQQKLMWADLLPGAYAQDGNLIGFNTTNIQCGTAITALVSCTTSEVVYFALESHGSKTFDFTKNQNFKGTAFTSVPLPAAVWLFGSGLLGLAGIARKRKTG